MRKLLIGIPLLAFWCATALGLGAVFASRVDAGAFAPASVGWTTVSKSADESRASNTTLTNDTDLTFAMVANAEYRIRSHVYFATTATADFKYFISSPASPTKVYIHWRTMAGTSSGTPTLLFENGLPGVGRALDGAGIPGEVYVDVCHHNGANAGNWVWQWAQNTSDASNTTVLAGSYIEWKKVD